MKKIIIVPFLCFLVAAIVTGLSAISYSYDFSNMERTLNRNVAIFRSMQKETSRNLVNLAQDRSFVDYFNASDEQERKRLKNRIGEIAHKVQKRFAIDEMCYIDSNGHEIVRIVFDKLMPDEELSTEEKATPFFKHGFAKNKRQVHIEKPYMSPDSKRWVIAYVTPVVKKDGTKLAILHYEMPLSKYQDAMTKKIESKDVLVVDKDGLLWSDSRHTYNLKGNPDVEVKLSDYFPPFEMGNSPEFKKILSSIKEGKSGKGVFNQNGKKYFIVYKPLGYFDWTLAVLSTK